MGASAYETRSESSLVLALRKEHAGLGGEHACAAREESDRDRLKEDKGCGQSHSFTLAPGQVMHRLQ